MKRFIMTIFMLTPLLWSSNNIIVLIDYSKSIPAEDWRIYDSAFASVVKSLQPSDTITLLPIGEQQQGSLHMLGRFMLKSKSNSPVKTKLETNQVIKKVIVKYKDLKTTLALKQGSTNIISSLRYASEYLKNEIGTKKIVILSDMVDSSQEMPFSSFANGSCSKINILIAKAKNKPDLSGIDIVARGASGSNDSGYSCLKNFWIEYLKRSNARNIDYSRSSPF